MVLENLIKIEEKEELSLTIYYAEDEKTLRNIVTDILIDMGHVVSAFANGKLLLEKLKRDGKCDLVITDNDMPELDGSGLLTKIRENDKTKDIPVIVLTGNEDNEVKKYIKQEGGMFFDKGKLKTIEEVKLLVKTAVKKDA